MGLTPIYATYITNCTATHISSSVPLQRKNRCKHWDTRYWNTCPKSRQ